MLMRKSFSTCMAVQVQQMIRQRMLLIGQKQQLGGESSIDLDFDSDVTLGLRTGVWLESYPQFGLAVDLSYFNSDANNANFSVVPISFLLMARMPVMVSAKFPNGRMQPYLAVGPSLMLYDYEIDLTPVGGRKIDESSGSLSLMLLAAIKSQADKTSTEQDKR